MRHMLLAVMRLIVGGRVGPASVDVVAVPAVLVGRHDVAEFDARHVGRRLCNILVLSRILKIGEKFNLNDQACKL